MQYHRKVGTNSTAFTSCQLNTRGELFTIHLMFCCCFLHGCFYFQGQAAAAASAATSAQVRAHVPVPSQDAIKEAILKRKKLALLKRLDGEEVDAEDE